MRTLPIIVAASLCCIACGPPDPEPVTAVQSAFDDSPGLFGGCILAEPIGEVPSDVYASGEVEPTVEYPPFTKKLMTHGLLLVAGDDASDDFMRLVARTIAETFPQDERLDLDKQREILRNHFRYRAVIPVPVGEDFAFMEAREFEQTARRNSICDIIMQDVPNQVMEVVEHILHYVSDIGLAHAFPDAWGISESSLIARFMREAIDAGYYDVAQYQEIGEGTKEHLRVLIQEYAYWVISTYWDLQEPYGPVGEAEWHIVTPDELRDKQPELYAMIERTVGRTMVPPSVSTLEAIGPTRAEERGAGNG